MGENYLYLANSSDEENEAGNDEENEAGNDEVIGNDNEEQAEDADDFLAAQYFSLGVLTVLCSGAGLLLQDVDVQFDQKDYLPEERENTITVSKQSQHTIPPSFMYDVNSSEQNVDAAGSSATV